jgi:hypothetical protein
MSIKVYDSKASLISDVNEHNPRTKTGSNNQYYIYMDSWESYSLAIENEECSVHITHKSVDRIIECLLSNKETHKLVRDKLERPDYLGKVKNVG